MSVPQTRWEQMVDRAMEACVRVFGDGPASVIFIHYGGEIAPYAIDGIFEAESIVVDPTSNIKVVSNQPQISFRLSQLAQMPDADDELIIRGVRYRADPPIFDGQGTVTIPLGRMT